MIEISLVLAGIFFAIVIGAAIEYYKQLVKLIEEYSKVKEAFNDMVLSFSRELKRTAENLNDVIHKADIAFSRSSDAIKKAEDIERKITILDEKISITPDGMKGIIKRLEEAEGKLDDIVASQDTLKKQITILEEKTQKLAETPEQNVEAVIPIKREKALAPLTETELKVIELLAAEGPKTAPEIKERIKLSREHTARLMKKLYAEGYLERDSSKIPFIYSVKKEMENILKKNETSNY